mmetsp:Transcript_2136/g.4832  ORF Transcript_2136/g.4832 Transcript_2136/m.4832 type:complete len:628 (+) Transcript_2136:143-2026(+)
MSVTVGMKVRVRPGVIPWYGWNGVTPNSIGRITRIRADGDCCVRFTECPKWLGRVSQLEPASTAIPRLGALALRRDAKVPEDLQFPAGGWVATPIRPDGSELERALFDGLVWMFSPSQPQHLHQGRDVQEDCPPYDGIRPAAVWQITSESCNNLYHMQREALARRLRRSSVNLHSEETHLSQFHSLLPVDLDTSVNEVMLLHGTKPEHVQDILSHGLNERLCSGIFGHGTYLAEDVEKIDQYTKVDEEFHTRGELRELHARLYGKDMPHPGSVYYAFVCRTTLGQAIHTKDGRFSVDNGDLWASGPDADIHELARIPGTSPSERHHSLIAELGCRITRFREFVVYHAGAQVLPEYLVAYHRTQDGTPIGDGYQRCQQQGKVQEAPQHSTKKPNSGSKVAQDSAAPPQRQTPQRRAKSRTNHSKAQASVAKILLPEQATAGMDESVDELIRNSRDASMILGAGGRQRGNLVLAACNAMSPGPKAPAVAKARRPSSRVEVHRKSHGTDLLRRRSLVRHKSGDHRRKHVQMPRLFGPDDLSDDADHEFAQICAEVLADGSPVGKAELRRTSSGSIAAVAAAEASLSAAATLEGVRLPPAEGTEIDELLEELSGIGASPVGGMPRIGSQAH